jgi:hypothetical protein
MLQIGHADWLGELSGDERSGWWCGCRVQGAPRLTFVLTHLH